MPISVTLASPAQTQGVSVAVTRVAPGTLLPLPQPHAGRACARSVLVLAPLCSAHALLFYEGLVHLGHPRPGFPYFLCFTKPLVPSRLTPEPVPVFLFCRFHQTGGSLGAETTSDSRLGPQHHPAQGLVLKQSNMSCKHSRVL